MRRPTRSTATGRGAQRAVVVEDDLPTLELLVELAASFGLEPVAFTHLSPARRAVQQSPPAILLVDDDLPDGKGADFAAEMMADPRMHDVRVVICTAADERRRRQIAHVGQVIPKPFALHQLERALEQVSQG